MTSKYTLEAIIFNEREVNALIWRIRNGKNPHPRTLSLYREHVMALSALLEALEQQAKSEAESTGKAPKVVEWIKPVPHGQIVGVFDPREKMRLGWKFWFKSMQRPAAPLPFLSRRGVAQP